MSTYVKNRKASFDFDFLKHFEAGLVLTGSEVKAVRHGKAKLEGSYVVVRGSEAFLVGASISEYQPANAPKAYDKERPRKLLLSKKEINEIETETDKTNLTAVAIRLYNNNGKIKLEFAIARGKKKFDKRETLKARDSKRDIQRTLKSQY
jgi:SsrA-binding protein